MSRTVRVPTSTKGTNAKIRPKNGPDFGQNATVWAEGWWVTFSECLKLCSYQLRLVSGNFWAFCKCLSPKTKNPSPVRWYWLFSPRRPDFGKNATVLAEGQWSTFSECFKLCSFQLRLVSGNSWAICKCLRPKTKNWMPVAHIELFSQIWSKSPKSKSAGGQWENISDMLKNISNQVFQSCLVI